MRVLGIDPGNSITGYGIVERQKSSINYVLHGEVKIAKGTPLSSRLITLYDNLLDVISQSTPDVIAIEDIFYGKNIKSLMRQSEARGVIILAGSHKRLPIYEYTPLEVKKAVVGYGRAEKSQIQNMVKAILHLSTLPPVDAADALAVAICHVNFLKTLSI
ncbi:MAG: crossover junction endodeoxyribonuclease [Deltaproteobacteria bacterium]|nr:crossover junction endodeoxyribonuclease [Bacteroidota bacterium]MBS1238522.1 crossover junction endodeoxyribonuclease [Deltaproteobacteria bacterium]